MPNLANTTLAPGTSSSRRHDVTSGLAVSIGQFSDKGRKDINQDFHGTLVPGTAALGAKGISVVLADGISSSSVGHIAAETAVKSFLDDYYCTADAWSVKTSGQRVITATNSWLYAQSRRGGHAEDMDGGYVCTFSALVLKSRTAHIFHVGDSRIHRLSGGALEQLTDDHRVVVSSRVSYLGRALGMNSGVEIDYRALPVEAGDCFVMTTDGVHEHVPQSIMIETIHRHAGDLDAAARAIAGLALDRGSGDNLTIQIVRVDRLPLGEASEVLDREALPLPPLLEPRTEIDGFRILRSIHSSSRSHIYLAEDTGTGAQVALKIPSIDLRDDPAYLRRFKMEEWIARRIASAHVLEAYPLRRKRSALYTVAEHVDGQTLAQWMRDNPQPGIEVVRGIVEQIARGVRAFHRREMIHQDLRPDNIMIDRSGTVKIIDFGSTKVAGVVETEIEAGQSELLGTLQYTAPECLLGEPSNEQSDFFSIGVIAYQMLTGHLPFGAHAARIQRPSDLRRLRYVPARRYRPDLPEWIDGALEKAVNPEPRRRYDALSELEYDLRHPRDAFLSRHRRPLLERDPLRFWQAVSALLAVAVIVLLIMRRT